MRQWYQLHTIASQPAYVRNELFNKSLDSLAQGVSISERIQTMQILKLLYQSSSSSSEKAQILNAIVTSVHAGHEEDIYNFVFSGEPFQKFLVVNDEQKSLQNLALLSLSLHPSAYAAQISTQAEGIYLEKLSLRGKSASPEVEPRIAAILERYNQAETLIGAELRATRTERNRASLQVSFHRWQGHLLANIATVRPEYLEPALNHLLTAIQIGETFDRKNNTQELERLITSSQYGYIRATSYSLNPKHRKQAHIFGDILAEKLSTRLDQYPSFAILFNALRDMNSSSHGEHTEFMHELKTRIQSLATSSPRLRSYLEKEGLLF
ncbi:hypothetical protein EBR66_04395 [bacterium]|nr:hypothetical protein [bacterium]